MSDETPDVVEATPAPRPVNPLLVPRRREVVELFRDDVAKKVDELAEQIDKLSVEITDLDAQIEKMEADADVGKVRPKRMNKASPLRLATDERDAKRAERSSLASQIDEAAEAPSVPLTFEEPTADEYTALQNEHPPRDDNRLDQMRGWNGDTLPGALARLCLVDPVVTDEQWAEFRASVTAYNWHRKILPAVQALAYAEPDLPKPFAVSALQQMDERGSRRQPGTESPPAVSTE